MKKYLILSLILGIFLVGCSQNNKADSNENIEPINKKELFAKIVSEDELESYVLNVNNEMILSTGSDEQKEISKTDGTIEVIKNPKIYHIKLQEDSNGNKNEIEEYIIDGAGFYKTDKGEWEKQLYEEINENKEEVSTFTPETKIDSSSLLEKLEGYYELIETQDAYALKLESNSNNIIEIKNILFGELESNLFLGELSSIKAEFSFEKDTYYPISFEWETHFLDDSNNVVTEIKQSGIYEKINQIAEIEIPDEIKDL